MAWREAAGLFFIERPMPQEQTMKVSIVEDYSIRVAKPFPGKKVGQVYVDPAPITYEVVVPSEAGPQAMLAASNAVVALGALAAGNDGRIVTSGDWNYLNADVKVIIDGRVIGKASIVKLDDQDLSVANIRANLVTSLQALQDHSWWPAVGGSGTN